MNLSQLHAQIERLHQQRLAVARFTRDLVALDIERKRTQVSVAREYREQVNPATDKKFSEKLADDCARTDERYTTLLDEIAVRTQEKEQALAEAEALAYGLQVEIASIQAAALQPRVAA